jgi:hypothetical protein
MKERGVKPTRPTVMPARRAAPLSRKRARRDGGGGAPAGGAAGGAGVEEEDEEEEEEEQRAPSAELALARASPRAARRPAPAAPATAAASMGLFRAMGVTRPASWLLAQDVPCGAPEEALLAASAAAEREPTAARLNAPGILDEPLLFLAPFREPTAARLPPDLALALRALDATSRAGPLCTADDRTKFTNAAMLTPAGRWLPLDTLSAIYAGAYACVALPCARIAKPCRVTDTHHATPRLCSWPQGRWAMGGAAPATSSRARRCAGWWRCAWAC